MRRLEEVKAAEVVSCDLPAEELGDRIGAWKDLGRAALGRTVGDGRIVTRYPNTAELRARLDHLIEAEARCCPFLVFEVREPDDVLEVELRYPTEFGTVVSEVIG